MIGIWWSWNYQCDIHEILIDSIRCHQTWLAGTECSFHHRAKWGFSHAYVWWNNQSEVWERPKPTPWHVLIVWLFPGRNKYSFFSSKCSLWILPVGSQPPNWKPWNWKKTWHRYWTLPISNWVCLRIVPEIQCLRISCSSSSLVVWIYTMISQLLVHK